MSWLSTPWDQPIFNNSDSDSDFDMDHASRNSDTKIRAVDASLIGESKVQDKHKSVWRCEESNVQRFPAILRTNRQIHSEASFLLYGDLDMYVQPGDVLRKTLWRHNPLHGIGSKNSCGQTVYAKAELDGVMEPHVFARFKKIMFEFELEPGLGSLRPMVPCLYINEDMTVNPEDEAKLLAFYRRSTVIYQLVKILSNSPDIIRFEIYLNIELLTQWERKAGAQSQHLDAPWNSFSKAAFSHLLRSFRTSDLSHSIFTRWIAVARLGGSRQSMTGF